MFSELIFLDECVEFVNNKELTLRAFLVITVCVFASLKAIVEDIFDNFCDLRRLKMKERKINRYKVLPIS